MCGGSPKMPEVPVAAEKPIPKIPTYVPVKDPDEAQQIKRTDNKAKLAAMYGMSRTNRTSGMGVPGAAGTSRGATAVGTAGNLGGGA